MANPKTILDYVTQQRNDAQQAVTAEQQNLAQAQTAINAKREALAKVTSAFAALEKQATDVRQKLSEIPTPADGEALLVKLERLIIRVRARQADIVQTQSELDTAQANAERAQANLASATNALAAAQVELKRANAAHKQRQQWKDASSAAPLDAIHTTAATALISSPYTDAEARINADVPAKLLVRAAERYAAARAFLEKANADAQKAEDDRLDEMEQNSGLTGKAEKLRVAFVRVETMTRDFIGTAKNQFDYAQSLLVRVADPTLFALTPEQKASITDATLKAKREAAADKEKAAPANWRAEFIALEEKIAAVAAAQTALTLAQQKAIAAKKNPATDPAVIQAKADLQQAQADLVTAETNYQKSDHGILHAWEAAVPDTLWELWAEFEKAKILLGKLKDSDPAKLKTDLEKAEEKFVVAKIKADTSARTLGQLTAEQTHKTALRQSAQQNAAQRLLSALRGDQ